MEGDAGASRLNPIDKDDSLGTHVTDEDSKESAAGAESTSPEATDEDPAATDEASPESEAAAETPDGVERRPSRVGRAWLVGISAVLLIAAGALAGGGYLALRYHQETQAIARNDAAALQTAKECVAATQAPDTGSMAASEQKIIDCGTDQYRTQALLYSSMLVQAYQAANVHLQVSDIRAAVERNNLDGSVDVLVALRVKVSNNQEQNQEAGYRLRVKMMPIEGSYKISKLEQVTK